MVDLSWKDYVEINPRYYMPSEVDILQGDYSKAKEKLDWSPKTGFKELIQIMPPLKTGEKNPQGQKAAEGHHRPLRISSPVFLKQSDTYRWPNPLRNYSKNSPYDERARV